MRTAGWFDERWNPILTRLISSQFSSSNITFACWDPIFPQNCNIVRCSSHDLCLYSDSEMFKTKLVSFYVLICRSINYIFLAGLSPIFSWEYMSIKPSEADERIIPRNGKTKWIMDHNNINTMSATLHVKSHCLHLPSLENQNLTAISFLIRPNFHIQTQL